ncbi:MAG TPA: Ig domain-containing protein [Streptosporangiaceae bacterium]
MSLPAPTRRWVTRASAVGITAVALGAGLQFTVSALAAPAARTSSTANPYSPAYHHPYRHGAVPTRGALARMRAWSRSHPGAIHPASTADLNFGGGIDGIGVTTGPERVYLVFYGSQWGTQGTDANGNVTLSGDSKGMAPYIQQLMKGLGTGGELWSGVMTQYCQGITTGSQTCPSGNTQHVGYPTGGALAGVWVDERVASPSQATAFQLGTEAVSAAAHFGNTTAASNRDAQYVILSPTGTHPDGFNTPTGNFCAWHDWNGDAYVGVTSPYGDIAFTNMPYVTDMGTSCGQNFVNGGTAGNLDGVSIVEGHEYAETITDQNPAGGWTDSTGAENGDKCAWNSGPGAHAADLGLTTGTFAMQSTWGNDGSGGAGACEFTHAIVTNGSGSGNTVTVSNPGSQTTNRRTAVSLQMTATDSASGQTFTWSATGLPPGLSISSSTGLISGTTGRHTGTYSVTVTATDTTGASGSTSFTWTIN